MPKSLWQGFNYVIQTKSHCYKQTIAPGVVLVRFDWKPQAEKYIFKSPKIPQHTTGQLEEHATSRIASILKDHKH